MDKNPQILEAVHEDLQQYAKGVTGKASLGGKSGRKPVYTSENLFRAVIVRKADVHQLWDSYDAFALRVRRILDSFDNLPRVRFHDRKTKKLYLDVTRFSRSTSKQRQRDCRRWTKKLIRSVSDAIARTEPLVEAAVEQMKNSGKTARWTIESDIDWLTLKYPVMQRIVDIAQRRQKGEKVPMRKKYSASLKIMSN